MKLPHICFENAEYDLCRLIFYKNFIKEIFVLFFFNLQIILNFELKFTPVYSLPVYIIDCLYPDCTFRSWSENTINADNFTLKILISRLTIHIRHNGVYFRWLLTFRITLGQCICVIVKTLLFDTRYYNFKYQQSLNMTLVRFHSAYVKIFIFCKDFLENCTNEEFVIISVIITLI